MALSDKEAKQREAEMRAKQEALNDRKAEIETLAAANTRLGSEKANSERDAMRLLQINSKLDEDVARLDAEVKSLQQQMVAIKLAEASEVVAERRKLLKVLDEERERSYWKENELLTKVRDLQTRLVESEATAEKFQSQYEDERVHVESLRHDVASLNTLLTQAHVAINAKHGAVSVRDYANPRSARSNPLDSTMPTGTSQAPSYDGMMMMKMMEFMAAMQGGLAPGVRHSESMAPDTHSVRADIRPLPSQANIEAPQESGEEKQLKDEQQRRERELLEQREYEKRQKERLEAEEREMAARRQQFEDDMARMRLAKRDEDERAEAVRKAQLAEEEARIQRQLDLQQKAIQDAREEQERLERQRTADTELRAQREKEEQDRQRDERLRQAEELEARIQKQRLEAEEADRQRSEKVAKEMEEIQKRREQLDAIEEERRRAEREKAEAEAKRLQEAEDELKREQELAARKEAERAAAEASREKQLAEQQADHDESAVALQPHGATDERDQTGGSESLRDSVFPSPELASEESGVATDASPFTAMSDTEGNNQGSNDGDEVQPGVDAHVVDPQDKTMQLESSCDDASRGDVGTTSEPSTRQEEAATASSDDSANEGEAASTSVGAEEAKTDVCAPDEDATPAKSEQELEEERRQHEKEQKRKQDDEVIDVYRQRVLARKAAEKQRQQELETERKRKEEEEEKKAAALREAQQSFHGSGDGSENELELSEGSFAESRWVPVRLHFCGISRCSQLLTLVVLSWHL